MCKQRLQHARLIDSHLKLPTKLPINILAPIYTTKVLSISLLFLYAHAPAKVAKNT